MPIGPGQIAPTPARLKQGRLGAMRLRYAPAFGGSVVVGNVDHTAGIRMGTTTIQDVINDTPNTCEFVAKFKPLAGQNVQVNYPGAPILFAGAIERVTQAYEGDKPANLAWRVTCQDYSRLLTRTVINKTYAEQSATAIATDLIAGTGVSAFGIAAGLPTVTGGIDFLDTTPREALAKLAQRIGGYSYVDYSKVLHLFITDPSTPPDPLLPTTASLMVDPPVTYEEDITQVRTRVIVTGGGSTTLLPIAAGASLIPVEDATLFAASGELRSDALRFSHTGKVAGGVATNVGSSIAAPSAAPSASLSTTQVGKIVGAVRYKYSYKNASGETLVGPASNTVTGVAFAAPPVAPSPGVTSGLGRLAGVYTYRSTNVTDRGETTPGPVSSAVAPSAFPPPSSGVSITGNGLGPLIGFYQYLCTFVTPYGETTGGAVNARTAGAVGTPGGISLSDVPNTIGPLVGNYAYRVSFVTGLGETLPGTASAFAISAYGGPAAPFCATNIVGPLVGNYAYAVSFVSPFGETVGAPTATFNCPLILAGTPGVFGDGTGLSIAYAVMITHPLYGASQLSARSIDTNKGASPVVQFNPPSGCGWNVYSTGTTTDPAGAPLFKVAEMGPGFTSFTHTNQTGPQFTGENPSMGRWVQVSNIPQGPTGTTSRRIYRTRANGSTLYLVGEITNNASGQVFNDTAPDDALTVQAPSANLNGKQVVVSFIPTGPTGTIARRVWRTKAGGSAYFLIGSVPDNSATSLTDATPDAALTVSAPITATAGGEQVLLGIPTGPSGTVARRVYRTVAGGSSFRLVAELPDNATTSIVDAIPDTQLSPVNVPVLNTAGGQNVQLSLNAGPAGTLARRLYRTRAGGSGEWFLVGQISDNTTGSFIDSQPDGSLGRLAPITHDAGASAVNVTIPTGPSGTASRRLYRTEGGGSVHRFVTEIRDNTTTAYVDGKADTELGDLPLDVSTIGALAGATSLSVLDASGFGSAGWARVDSQIITWSNRTATTLTGIPSSGDGAIRSSISAGSGIVALPLLTGVSGLPLPLLAGASVNLLVQRDDLAAQAALAAREGFGTGVIEYPLTDTNLSATEATARADAELALFSKPIGRLRYASRDLKTASGKRIPVNLPSLGVNGTFTIQSVTITEVGIAGMRANPLYTVDASTLRFSLDDALRRLLSGMGGL